MKIYDTIMYACTYLFFALMGFAIGGDYMERELANEPQLVQRNTGDCNNCGAHTTILFYSRDGQAQ